MRSRLGGVTLEHLASDVLRLHAERLHRADAADRVAIANRGEYQWRRDGELHLFNPRTVQKLQHATRERRYDIFKEYTRLVDDQSRRASDAALAARTSCRAPTPLPLDEVESVASIVTRFSTGAMSYGSISEEAHTTLAIAMNRLGAKSNTGEGGEDEERYDTTDPRQNTRSAIKQVASGRFGVTSRYLVNADDLQIKMAQGAKPGEGGQLPGAKVYPWIAKTRHSTPGRRAHLAAAAPRHLLDRGPRPADLRPQVRQRPGPHPREARERAGSRHHRRRRRQGPRRRHLDLGPRRGHRRGAAHVAQARGHALGAGPRRGASDPGRATDCAAGSCSRPTDS